MRNIVNIINFVRGIEPRPGRNIDLKKPVQEQIRIMKEYGLKGTFLAQFDALCDCEMVELLKTVPEGTELGLWLEIVQPQVEKIGLKWRGRYPWDWHNDVGFLIGYAPDERKSLIDVHMEKFKEVIGYIPKAVGSWHIDAVSMKYLHAKYDITACCICRDQVGTDGYTMQGGYYNQAYYPSQYNMFSPAQTKENQIDMPVFRMLGSSPVFAYDCQLFDYDGVHNLIPTLEPAQLAVYNEWGDFLLDEIFDNKGISFQYTQIGQENSFGWDRMQNGINFQFRKVSEMKKQGKVEILTLSEAGDWYKRTFKNTPPTAYVAEKQWKTNNIKSYWYNSKYYRVNFVIENDVLRMRDMYIFDEKHAEKYLDNRCTIPACEYRNLPVFDGVFYSDQDKNLKAGCYFCVDDEKITWDDVNYSEDDSKSILSLSSKYGNLQMELSECQIELITDIDDLKIIPVYDRDNVYGGKGNNDEAFANNNGKATVTYIDSIAVYKNHIDFKFDDFYYSIHLLEGHVSEELAFVPKDGRLILSLLQS